MKGRKRHLVVDTMGLVLVAVAHSAGLQDDDKRAAGQVFWRLACRGFWRLKVIWADGSYEGSAVMWARMLGGWALRLVRRLTGAGPGPRGGGGFVVLPRRWVVERTFAWLGRYRRLSKDYEYHPHSSETMIYLAMLSLMARRLEPG